MSLEPSIWSNFHAASTHFPIALVLVSAFCDAAALFCKAAEAQRAFRSTAIITIALGALGGIVTAGTGLITTKGQFWGHGTLLRDHQFVWPALLLIVGLATWRVICTRKGVTKPSAIYLVLMLLAVALVSGAGYWGGELLNKGVMLTPPSAVSVGHGRQLFVQSCAHCHGNDARGSGEDGDGPDLYRLRIGNARIATVIRTGIPEEMPSFAKKHGPVDIADLTCYLRSLQ